MDWEGKKKTTEEAEGLTKKCFCTSTYKDLLRDIPNCSEH